VSVTELTLRIEGNLRAERALLFITIR